ncbi:hypothetical protein RND81_08G159500 [Saponaria officinalis]|uniref:Uncharacterized protein n=1 Tax=Saponaria officinalis TaxID=3572 RepID=A0AAW1J9H4_SAPOF
MKSLVFYLVFSFLFLSKNIGVVEMHDLEARRTHVVYMGSSNSSAAKDMLNKLVENVVQRNEVRVYQHGFLGFAAPLSVLEAAELATHPAVVSVFPDPILKLQTTRSWDFLKAETSSFRRVTHIASSPKKSDTIIGILDTGVWPESESFNDKGMHPIPSRWKGECMEGSNFKSSNCNRKLIGARYYKLGKSIAVSPRDTDGHGTHVASTAGGNPVHNASFYGIAAGTARGAAPSTRIAVYRVCKGDNCFGSAVLAAFDDAIKDGVDVLSLSIGVVKPKSPLFKDPIAIGSFHAVQKGITVVCAAGNFGPSPQSVANFAPWIITVGATTIDRFFESRIVLGNKRVFQGEGINFYALKKSPVYELVDGSGNETRICKPKSLVEKSKVNGKIVLCNFDRGYDPYQLRSSKAVGVIGIRGKLNSEAKFFGILPATVILSKDASKISKYIGSSRKPVATILATRSVFPHKPAPIVPNFSARGPVFGLANLIKPDIVAPGVQILASWIDNDPHITFPGKEAPQFSIISGTSMACPHVSGIVVVIKSHNPTWTPAIIRSAIMTTAIGTDNLKEPIQQQQQHQSLNPKMIWGRLT